MSLLTRSLQANNNHLIAQATHTLAPCIHPPARHPRKQQSLAQATHTLARHMHTSTCTLSTHQASATTRIKSTQTTYKVTVKNNIFNGEDRRDSESTPTLSRHRAISG
ncbi:hypothetical protein CF326_g9944 [Tilletia indica]|nr:hypothetical protein CF326_g9944 [Tilletia indica]